jgi:cobyrinic acid a,c-diamide synthase
LIKALVVAGVSSGVGKTTVTLGLLQAFRRRSLTVQAFKVGPDFIDPGLHAQITGRPSYNLDGWMGSRESVIAGVARHNRDADLALVEGMMGCFDGLDAKSEDGSTAQVAKWLGAPVVLVVDAGAIARSAGAVVLGF